MAKAKSDAIDLEKLARTSAVVSTLLSTIARVGAPFALRTPNHAGSRPLSAMPADLRPHIRYPQGLFAIQGKNNAVALEFFLVSTQTGNTLWQANTITTKGAAIGFKDIANGLVKNALKNLAKAFSEIVGSLSGEARVNANEELLRMREQGDRLDRPAKGIDAR